MIPFGYMYKRVALTPKWLDAPLVSDIYSCSGCVSVDFTDYIQFWRHNGYWLFDSADVIQELARQQAISLDGLRLFYFEGFEQQFDDFSQKWVAYQAEPSLPTAVVVPQGATLQGFDVTSFSAGVGPECSPLSCNSLAQDIPTNSHCLFDSLQSARSSLVNGAFANTEPGPFRVVAVYTVEL